MIDVVTGHRPKKIGGYSKDARDRLVRFTVTHYATTPRIEVGISGMALGWDQACALAWIELAIPFIAAVPFDGQESTWPYDSKRLYHQLLKAAAEVHVVSPGAYEPWKMQTRNEWMVDKGDHLTSLWNGSAGGTANCIEYALKIQKPHDNLWQRWAGK